MTDREQERRVIYSETEEKQSNEEDQLYPIIFHRNPTRAYTYRQKHEAPIVSFCSMLNLRFRFAAVVVLTFFVETQGRVENTAEGPVWS